MRFITEPEAKLKGAYGGGGRITPPTPDFAGHRGSLQGKIFVCLRQCKALRATWCRSMSANFLEVITCGCKGFLVVTKKSSRRAFYITAGRCTLSPPPSQKGASFAPEQNNAKYSITKFSYENKHSFEQSFTTFRTVFRSLTHHCTDSIHNKQKNKKLPLVHIRSRTAHAKSTRDFALQNSIYLRHIGFIQT